MKLVKDIVPVSEQLGDPGKFDLHIDGEGAYDASKTDAVDGDSVELTVPNGSVDLSEAAGTGTSLGDYTSAYSCTAQGHDAVSGSGTSISDLPLPRAMTGPARLRTRVRGSREAGQGHRSGRRAARRPGKFDLHIDGEGAYEATKSDAGDGDSVELTVPNGTVDLDEAAGTATSLSDYTTTYDCTAEGRDAVSGSGTEIANLAVAAGDDWTCTLTNSRHKGQVTLVKDIVPVDEQLGDPGKFDLHIDGEGAYDAPGPTPATRTPSPRRSRAARSASPRRRARTRASSDYVSSTSARTSPRARTTHRSSADGTSIPGLVVSGGDDWRCTLRNERKQAVVKLTKVIVAVDQQLGDPGKFDLNIDGEGDNDKTRTDAVNGDSVTANVPNGNVALSEAGGTQTSLGDYSSLRLRERRRGLTTPRSAATARRSPASWPGRRRLAVHAAQHAQAR